MRQELIGLLMQWRNNNAGAKRPIKDKQRVKKSMEEQRPKQARDGETDYKS